ncbi:MAG TPA: FAD-binding oxidoreductase [Thermoleophilaceae bacterium]|nr:FAD-binding oxidoreductase [Thermoleophilaceae bacterium]
MSTTDAASRLDPLRSRLNGQALAPGEDGWDAARQAWNLLADQRPAGVVFAQGADDVVATVEFASREGLRVAPQGTGHSATALESLSDTLLLKTMRMSAVQIDAGARRARVEAGALWGDLAVAAGEHGLAGLSGSSPDVGVVGYSLGGGVGWLGRPYGLASNSIVAAEVVTAAGELVRADHDNEAELFWALRGGGGSFGVVTALELELFPVAELYAGSIMWPVEQAAEVMHAYREWARTVPDELTSGVRLLNLPPIPEVPEPLRGRSVVDVTGAFLGGEAEGAALLEPLRGVGQPFIDGFASIPPAGLSRIYGDPEQPTPGMTHSAPLLSELTPEAVDALVELGGPGSGTPLLMLALRHLGGALGSAPAGAGALDSLDGEFVLYGVGVPMAPEQAGAIAEHLDRMVEAVSPWASGPDYLNLSERPVSMSSSFREDVLERLRDVKASVNPNDMFVASHPVA